LDDDCIPAQFAVGRRVRQILVDRIDRQRKSVGMVVGSVTPAGRRLIAHGELKQSVAFDPNAHVSVVVLSKAGVMVQDIRGTSCDPLIR